ncbi:MAG TPA: Rieske 2Fe-2S domain-containing protein [Candidatus Eisenbacteria bacterium]|nr:Rieske 2Fe-2S domain-containing protein [Candidatus Eisenbacteria bacterium]
MELTVAVSLLFLVLYAVGLGIRKLLFVRDRRRMRAETRAGGRRIARAGELGPGEVKKFWIICRKYKVDAFLVNDRGRYYAYVNRCRHMPTPLDFVRDQFWSEDGRYLMCYTHGALYEPSTGRCVSGPCKDQRLYRLPVRIENGEILVGCPEGDISYLAD